MVDGLGLKILLRVRSSKISSVNGTLSEFAGVNYQGHEANMLLDELLGTEPRGYLLASRGVDSSALFSTTNTPVNLAPFKIGRHGTNCEEGIVTSCILPSWLPEVQSPE